MTHPTSGTDVADLDTASGVDYRKIDPAKRLGIYYARQTEHLGRRLGIQPIIASRGESVFLFKLENNVFGFTIEGLGTKNLIADALRHTPNLPSYLRHRTFYDHIAMDNFAMVVNDLITLGIFPAIFGIHMAAGADEWFEDLERLGDYYRGTVEYCLQADCVFGPGETPTLLDIIFANTVELSGAAIGRVPDGMLPLTPTSIRDGDAIIAFESSGIHANGITSIRKNIARLPAGYATLLPSGRLFGEALLDPTPLYVKQMWEIMHECTVRYAINVTGHGWRKLMRADAPFTYTIDQLPTPREVFPVIQRLTGHSDEKMYASYNMGLGFAVIVPESDVSRAIAIANANPLWPRAYHAGCVTKSADGKKRVVIPSLNITYAEETLNLRG